VPNLKEVAVVFFFFFAGDRESITKCSSLTEHRSDNARSI